MKEFKDHFDYIVKKINRKLTSKDHHKHQR